MKWKSGWDKQTPSRTKKTVGETPTSSASKERIQQSLKECTHALHRDLSSVGAVKPGSGLETTTAPVVGGSMLIRWNYDMERDHLPPT